MEIVYCGGCGRVLRREDFDRGLASRIDNRPWCSDCKPVEKETAPGAGSSSRRQGSTGKQGRIGVGTTRRDVPASKSSRTLLVGVGAAIVVGVLILAAFFAGTSTPRNPEKLPRGDAGPDRSVAASAEARRLLKELETLASLAPPERVLARCEELRAKFVGLPEDKAFQELQNAARELQRTRGQGSQLTKELDALRKLIDEDPRYSKSEEIVRRFQAARDIAGGRAAEVERRLADYQKERKAAPFEKHAGPFSEDDQGFIRHWLILGVFPNDNDKGFDVDFLKTESTHEPVAGLPVGKLSWAAYDSPEWKIDFFRVSHLNIKKPKDYVVSYAACLVQTTEELASEFRLGSNDGGALWVDGRLLGKVHRPRSLKVDEDRYAVPLSPGVHRILVKVEQHTQAYEFALRVVSPEGKPLPGLKIWE
jgi:hypothetical protein